MKLKDVIIEKSHVPSKHRNCMLEETSPVLELQKRMGSDLMTPSPDGGSAVSCIGVLASEGLSARGTSPAVASSKN